MFGTTISTKETEKKPGIFSRLFGSGKSNKSTAGDGSNSANSQASGVSDASMMGGLTKFGVSEADRLFDLATQLGSSKKLGFSKNTESFNKVISELKEANRFMSCPFGGNKDVNMMLYQENITNFQNVVTTCEEYLNSHSDPSSSYGKNRRSLVSQIKSMAQSDVVKFSNGVMDFYALTAEQQSETSLPELLANARTVQLHTDDLIKLRDSKATGGGASDVLKLNVDGGNVGSVESGKQATHYFKFEDEIDTSKILIPEDNQSQRNFLGATAIDNMLERFPEIKGTKDEKIIREFAKKMNGGGYQDKDLPLQSLTDSGKAAMKAINSLMVGTSVTYDNILHELGYNSKETERKVNMSKRNVATSRVAEILGMGHLVAKSETAEIIDDNNNVFRGNMMESAIKGKSSVEIAAEQQKGEAVDALKKASKGSGYQLKISASGGLQRDMCNLQILDCICGQVDRHGSNFIISQNAEGEMTGVQGIDNDASFGLNEDNSFARDKARHNRSVVNRETGTLAMPFIDNEAAQRIESLDGSVFEYILKDLLTDDEIKACITRFEKIKQAIKKTRSEEPERFLKNENDWNDDTAQKMIDHAWDMTAQEIEMGDNRTKLGLTGFDVVNRTKNYQTYFGRMMADTMLPGLAWDRGIGASPKVKRHKK